MSSRTVLTASPQIAENANDRFKRSFASTFWGSLMVAVALHFTIFAFFPDFSVAGKSNGYEPPEILPLPDNVELPPPPERIERPAAPIAGDVDVDITIPLTRLDPETAAPLPPPPITRGDDESRTEAFTVFTVAPRLLNREEVERSLQRAYPAMLRDAGVGARVELRVHVDENGRMISAEVSRSGGHSAFDRAALDVARIMRFSPALNRDRRVSVWVSVPLTFEVR